MIRVLVLVLFFAVAAQAQPHKPVGAFSASGDSHPGWIGFSHFMSQQSDGAFFAAAEKSQTQGFIWLLVIEAEKVTSPDFQDYLEDLHNRLLYTGLRPYVAAVALGEEWYEHRLSGAFGPVSVAAVQDYLGRRHGEARTILGLPVVWITTLVNNDPRYGELYHRPVPSNTDVLAIDAYVGDGGSIFHAGQATFELDVEPVLQHAVATTTLPIVVIAQWFQALSGPHWRKMPRLEDVAKYARWHAHPRVIATMGFLWESRPEVRGLDAMPDLRRQIEQAYQTVK